MAKRRQKNPNPIKAKTPEDWWDVEFMDVETHLSKAGNMSIRVDYSVDERDFPVSVYYSPDNKNEFARKKWRKFKADMAEHGHEPKGKTLDSIVELSEDWLQPDRIGVIVSDSDDGEYENIEVVAYDWGSEDNQDPENQTEQAAVDADGDPIEQDDLPF